MATIRPFINTIIAKQKQENDLFPISEVVPTNLWPMSISASIKTIFDYMKWFRGYIQQYQGPNPLWYTVGMSNLSLKGPRIITCQLHTVWHQALTYHDDVE